MVLKERHRFSRHFQCQLLMLRTCHATFVHLLPVHHFLGVEVAKFESCCQQAFQADINFGFCDFTLRHSFWQSEVVAATFHVGAGTQRLGRRFMGIGRHAMPPGTPEVIDGAAVAGDNSFEPPFLAENLLEVTCVAAAGVSVNALIGTHHFCHVALLHESLECREISLP